MSTSVTGRIEGPYQFQGEVLSHFAHNPTIRQTSDGIYLIYFIGGWPTNASDCRKGGDSPTTGGALATATGDGDTCLAGVTYDDPHRVRVGEDYLQVTLAVDANITDCAASCCGDAKYVHLRAFCAWRCSQ
jgi:hypothetical protein